MGINGIADAVEIPGVCRNRKLSRMITENNRIAVSLYIEKERTALYQAAEARELEEVWQEEKRVCIL